MQEQILKDAKERMTKSVAATAKELGTIRTGKASPSLLDTVRVESYGSVMPLNQLATITVPEARLLVVQAFDKNTVGDIAKAIQKADLGLNPSVDGQIIRLPIPPLNEERRKELVKRCKTVAEDGRVAIRNIRRDAKDSIKEREKNKDISEDAAMKAHDDVQELTDTYINQVDALCIKKERELMEV